MLQMERRRNPADWLPPLSVVLLSVCLFASSCSSHILTKTSGSHPRITCDPRADQAMMDEEYEAGILLHQRFLGEQPDNALALYHLGYAYGVMGDHEKEILYYEKAIKKGLYQEDIFFNLGMACSELGYNDKAIDAFKRTLEINPNHTEARSSLELLYEEMNRDNTR